MISAEGVAGAGYYTGGGGSSPGASYYTGAVGAVEPAGQWSGGFAATLGLEGEVQAEDMEAVFDRFRTPDDDPIGSAPRSFRSFEDRVADRVAALVDPLPEDVARIRSDVEQETRSNDHGADLTFAPSKSVTVAHAAAWRGSIESIRSGDDDRSIEYESIRSGIEEDVQAASVAALEYLESVATTRQGAGHGHAVTWVPVDGLAVASFLQHTSRADDPQLHVHNAILNRAVRSTDGAVRTLAMADLVGHKLVASAIADRVLAERLADRGIPMAVRPDELAREILGIDRDILDAYSQRSQAISQAAAPVIATAEERLGRGLTDVERGRINEWANLATRDSKTKDVDVDTLLDGWQDRLTREIGQGLVPIADQLLLAMSRGPVGRDGTFSPDAVASEALARVSGRSATWSRGALMVEIELALPLLGLTGEEIPAALAGLTDHALATQGVEQVAGNPGRLPPADLVAGSYVPASAARYAAPTTLAAERAIREATVEHRGHAVAAAAVDAWLSENYRTMGPDQRSAVVGLASRDVALAQLVGPAGTGKSFTSGALAGAWGQLSDGGRVIGLAVSQPAADVLAGDGVGVTANMAAWQAAQARLEAGTPLPRDLALAAGPRDVMLLDEASMMDTTHVSRVLDVARSAGARVVLTGDHRQLGAIGAGGAMSLVQGYGDTYTLSDARRFSQEWERSASLGLRDGSLDALREYDIHGRLIEADDLDAAIAAAARTAAAERLAGRTVSVTADTNADAHRVANAVREHLVAAGVVEADLGVLARTGGLVGIGDEIMTRQIDRELGVLNGSTFTVAGVGEDGSLSVVDRDGVLANLPSSYVEQHVQHAYASTVHSAQGKTVDVGIYVTAGGGTASAAYVALTRGQDRNTAFVAVAPDDQQKAVTAPMGAGEVRLEGGDARPSAYAVLADTLQRDTEQRAALVEREIDDEHLASMRTVIERLEDSTQWACRARLDDHLDRLVEDGVLSTDARASLAADQSTIHLSRVCRAAEQAGNDPAAVLRQAIEGKSLDGLRSAAQGIAARISAAIDVSATSASSSSVPAGLPAEWSTYLEGLHADADRRAAELGGRIVQDVPVWAERTLGPVPDDAVARLEWQDRAGRIAAYREASGHENDARAIPAAPGITQTEARASWWQAWEALGRPSETRVEAALSDGALRARVTGWEREQEWAPVHADASLKAAELDASEARHEAILARAAGRDDDADEWEGTAAERAAVAQGMARVAEARGAWAEQTALTREVAARAAEELESRGLKHGEEPDRVTAEEWLAHQREADVRDEAARDVTELDVPIVEDVDSDEAGEEDGDERLALEVAAAQEAGEEEAERMEDHLRISRTPGSFASGRRAGADKDAERSADARWKAAERATRNEWKAALKDATVIDTDATIEESDIDAREDEEIAADVPEKAPTSPAKVEAPLEPTDVELEVMVHVADEAQERVADRASEEAAHDTWETEQSAAPEQDDSPVAEHVAESSFDAADTVGAGVAGDD